MDIRWTTILESPHGQSVAAILRDGRSVATIRIVEEWHAPGEWRATLSTPGGKAHTTVIATRGIKDPRKLAEEWARGPVGERMLRLREVLRDVEAAYLALGGVL